MPLYIEEINSQLTVIEGEVSLTEAQMSQLIEHMAQRLETQQYEQVLLRRATSLRRQFAPTRNLADLE